MLRLLFAVVALILAPSGSAGLLDIYRLDDGHTNWQYLANTTATVLIITLSYTIFRLFRSHQETRQHNRDLEAIRGQLEERVKERTASLRQSESYLNDILRSMPMMLIGLDREAVVTQWNQRAEELTGLEAKDVVGRKLWQAYPLITVTPEQIQAVLESGKGRMIRQSQRGRFHFDVTIYPLDEQDEPGVVVLLDDVTERVMAQNSLVERDKLSSMGELAASLAHDISTPLQVIRRDIDKVRANINGTAAAEPLLDDALERAEQVSAVVGNLVQFSRAMADDMQPTSMTRLIDHSLDLASALLTVPSGLGFRDIRVERDFEDDLPEIPCHPT
ncbi:MAG: PAS domain S-box protein [Pseudomonadota bacterium]